MSLNGKKARSMSLMTLSAPINCCGENFTLTDYLGPGWNPHIGGHSILEKNSELSH